MEEHSYHHGDLRRALVETGLRLIHEQGEAAFSLRRVAAMCGVSSAAPYAHFKSKEELLEAMKGHVTRAFLKALERAKGMEPPGPQTLLAMGRAYVLFFKNNPPYYSFLFSRRDLTVLLDADADPAKNYPPFALFQQTAQQVLKGSGLSPERVNDAIIASWAMVHGLSAIVSMENVTYAQDWEGKIEPILTSLAETGGQL